MSVTKLAWNLFRAAEIESGRKFTAADRKGKDSEWAKAMFRAYEDVTRERRIAAVQHLLVELPEHDRYSLDFNKRSESRLRERNQAVEHNMRLIAEATEKPLNQKQSAEAKVLGLSVKEYHNTTKLARSKGMSVKGWCLILEAEEAKTKEKERADMEQSHLAWLTEQNNKKVAAMRSRYTRRRY